MLDRICRFREILATKHRRISAFASSLLAMAYVDSLVSPSGRNASLMMAPPGRLTLCCGLKNFANSPLHWAHRIFLVLIKVDAEQASLKGREPRR